MKTERGREPISLLPFQSGFEEASFNINALVTHTEDLRIFLELYKTDISLINETKLNETVRDDEVDILGYDITRRDRITQAGG